MDFLPPHRFYNYKGESMNYFQLVNKCLVELNYKQVNSFAELIKNEHKKIKNQLRLVNNEICNYSNWDFKIRKTELTLPKNTNEINNTINGRIASIIIDGHVYKYFEKPELYILNKAPSNTYSSFDNNLLLPKFTTKKTLNVIYYTFNTAKNTTGKEIAELTDETDTSLIPTVFAEPLLVYGTCLRLKANPQHVKFSYWLSMYNQALANMKSKISIDANLTPSVITHRY